LRRLFLLGAAPLLAANLSIPYRSTTAAGGLEDAFLAGQSPPVATTFDQDGMEEHWSLLAGFPLPVSLGLPEGASTSCSQGNAWASPVTADSLDLERRPGLGGDPWLELHPAASFPDTPQTHVSFWRGAVGSSRFGLDMERDVTDDVGMRVDAQIRAYPSRGWSYRDQTNSIYVTGSRPLSALPTSGTTPGLDEMRWEAALAMRLPGGSLEGGWRWTDVSRGWLDADTAISPAQGRESRQEGFLEWGTTLGPVRVDGGATIASVSESQPQWELDTALVTDRFDGTESKARTEIRWQGQGWSAGPTAQLLWQSGSMDDTGSWDALVHREGAQLKAGDTATGLHLRALAGLTTGSLQSRDIGSLEDWSGNLGWTNGLLDAEATSSRWFHLPLLPEAVLGDAQTRWFPASDLAPERIDLQEGSLRLTPWRFLSVDGSVAALGIDDRIAPRLLPTSRSTQPAPDTGADGVFQLSNLAGTSTGWGASAGILLRAGGWSLRSEVTRSELQTPSGAIDLSLPQLSARSVLDWQGRVLAGHMLLEARLGATYTSSTYAWVPEWSTLGYSALLREQPSTTVFDLETRFEIGRFGLFWNIQNLSDQTIEPTPGWRALGIHIGFGVHWLLAG
jgi:hypothetical protein